MKIICVAGLPGSGKTTLLETYRQQGAYVVDDITNLNELPCELPSMLVISDVNFCRDDVREAARRIIQSRYPQATISWKFFENSPLLCRENALRRNDGRNVLPDIDHLSSVYRVPVGADIHPVYNHQAVDENDDIFVLK